MQITIESGKSINIDGNINLPHVRVLECEKHDNVIDLNSQQTIRINGDDYSCVNWNEVHIAGTIRKHINLVSECQAPTLRTKEQKIDSLIQGAKDKLSHLVNTDSNKFVIEHAIARLKTLQEVKELLSEDVGINHTIAN